MSEQAEQTSGEPGSPAVAPIVAHSSAAKSPDPVIEPAAASAIEAESPGLVPEQGATSDTPEGSAPKVEAKADAAKVEAPREAPKVEASGQQSRPMSGKVMIMSSADRAWNHEDTAPEVEPEPRQGLFGKRRFSALAAVVALAVIAGALGGAMATAGLQQFAGNDPAPAPNAASNAAFDATVARIDADIVALKASVEHTSKLGLTQFNKTNDRLDKVEKAELEPAVKLAKLSEAVDRLDKLRTTPAAPTPVAAAASAPAAAKEVTGSITPPAAAPKVEVGRLPTVDGWILRDVANGGALIEGRQGIYEVYAGDPVPGLGRVDAIRRQDGHWVVVTSKGLIVAR